MLGFLRRLAGTWPARLMFIVLVAAFGLWGIGGATRAGLSDPESVASVGGVKITRADLEGAYQQELARVSRMMPDPSQMPPSMRAGLMRQALDGLVVQQAIVNHAYALGLAAPDDWVRQTVFAIPAFQDASGHFDHAQFDRLLTTRGLTEARFLDLVRDDLVQRQLIEQVRVGAAAPAELTRRVFGFLAEQRVAQVANLPFAAVPAPAPPAAAVLQRWYDNHPEDYARPEYRRIRLVILDADTIARGLSVPEADVQAAYTAQRASFDNDGSRSVQVVSAPSQAAATTIATAWRGAAADPAAWAAIQKQAQALGGAAADLATVTRAQMPSEALAAPVFAATEGSVVGPVNTPLGWQVARVSGIVPGTHKTFDDVKAVLAHQIAQARAADQLDGAADKLQDKLAGGAGLDEIPADAGAAAVEGTLDATGLTQDGEPAPVPAPADARAQIIAKAFATAKGAPTQLTQIPGAPPPGAPPGTPPTGAVWYAVQVEAITPPARRPYPEVADKVLADWRHDAVRHTQESAAASLLAAVQSGPAAGRVSLDVAAKRAGIMATLTPPISRSGTTPGVPVELARAVFALRPGAASMVETADGFTVAALARIVTVTPAEQQPAYDRLAAQLTQSLGNDVELAYAGALRDRASPSINQAALDQMSPPQ